MISILSCSTPEKDKVQYYESALEYIEKQDREAAILQLLSALQVDAKYGEAHYQLGLLYLEEKAPKKAFGSLIRAADLMPDNIDANLKVAQFYLMNRQQDESRSRVEAVLAKEPGNVEALTLLANLEISEGNSSVALSALDTIGDSVETSAELQRIKGRAFAADEKWEEAENAFLQALSLDKDDLGNYQTLLMLYQKNQDRDKTKKLLDEMEARFPEKTLVQQLLANYYNSVGDQGKTVEKYNKLVEIAPDNPRFRLQLSEYFKRAGDDVAAEKTLVDAMASIDANTDIKAALGLLYFDKGRFDEANSLLEEIRKIDSGHGGAKLLDARFLLKNGQVGDAISILNGLNNDFPNWGEPYFYLGLAHFSKGTFDLAQGAVAAAIAKVGKNAKYHTLMAQIYHSQKKFELAQKEALVALRLNPKNLRSAIILSRALISLKEYDKAIALLDDINDQVQANPEVLEALAFAYLGNKQLKEGEKTLLSLLDVYPGHLRAILMLRDIRYSENPLTAESFLLEQIEQSPDSSRLYLLLGETLMMQGKKNEAHESFKKAQELKPEEIEPYIAQAKLLAGENRRGDAVAVYEKALSVDSKSLAANMGLADVLQVDGKYSEAMVRYREVIKYHENYAPAINNLAWLVASDPEGDLGEALMFAMKAKQLAPESAVIADTLGWVHYKRGSYGLAVGQFETALKQLPGNLTMLFHLALAQVGKGDLEKAVENLEVLLEKDATFPEKEEAEELLQKLKS